MKNPINCSYTAVNNHISGPEQEKSGSSRSLLVTSAALVAIAAAGMYFEESSPSLSLIAQGTALVAIATIGINLYAKSGQKSDIQAIIANITTPEDVKNALNLGDRELHPSEQSLIEWCFAKQGDPECAKRIDAAKQILRCYAEKEAILDLSNKGITHLPENLRLPDSLQTLDLSDNGLYSLPENLHLPDSLQTLDLNRNNLTRLPENLDLPIHFKRSAWAKTSSPISPKTSAFPTHFKRST